MGSCRDGKVFRNASRQRIFDELRVSLHRLRTDYVDLYQVHWPDPLVPPGGGDELASCRLIRANRFPDRDVSVPLPACCPRVQTDLTNR